MAVNETVFTASTALKAKIKGQRKYVEVSELVLAVTLKIHRKIGTNQKTPAYLAASLKARVFVNHQFLSVLLLQLLQL
jgi:hypothetical protein